MHKRSSVICEDDRGQTLSVRAAHGWCLLLLALGPKEAMNKAQERLALDALVSPRDEGTENRTRMKLLSSRTLI